MYSSHSKSAVPKPHMARFLYSQIDLGSDDESSRGASPASSLSRSRVASQSKINYDDGKLGTSFSQGKLNESAISQKNKAAKNGVDINVQRKIDGNLKWFTSHIPELPGPKSEVIQNIGEQYKQ